MSHESTGEAGQRATEKPDGDIDLSVHILSVSAALVGVCLTVIGLLQVVDRLRNSNTPLDNVLAVDSVLFLISGLLAYGSLRSRSRARRQLFERLADSCFLCALIVMACVAAAIAFEIT
jgi:uncharacterized membrane protein HdeD (DUF308 family)